MLSSLKPGRYLGMHPGDLEGKPYARFWNPRMSGLPDFVRAVLAHGPIAEPLLPPLETACGEVERGASEIENGYCLVRGGAMHIAISTAMPRVTPAMLDWWFGWHSEEPQRYKLWHPRAHVHAAWRTPLEARVAHPADRARYLNRTSCVDEYIGSTVGSYAIHFLTPAQLGFNEKLLADAQRATAICARVGLVDLPFDVGYLAHYVTATPEGSIMRSRFWLAGRYAAPRSGGPLGSLALWITQRVLKPKAADAAALLVHCSQEMSHLATFLPDLHAELGSQ